MTTIKKLKTILALALVLPMALSAQTDVNRDKYPDYTDKTNPDWSLMQYTQMQKSASRTATKSQRPAYVNNAELKFFPPVFNQDGGSCGSASRICYMFTYELNAYRNLNGKLAKNYYPSHFVWLHTNTSSGKNEFVTSIGVPSAATYGGQTYSSLFGYQDCADNDFGWMQGYDKWFEAMHNRMLEPSNFPVHVGTEEGREAVKNWLWNHSGDASFQAGGICGIGVASTGGNYDGSIPSTTANRNAGVVGKKYLRAWGTQVDHALTIVGYDDRIEFDLDGNGIAGEVEKDEVGAWIIVNSWGTWWGNSGFIYCPYAYGGASFNSNGTFAQNWWTPEIYKVRKDYRPLRTIKLEMDYSRRSEIKLSAGISADLNATVPERTIDFEHFKYAGDGNYGNTNPAPEVPMLGRWADGKYHTEPMEFGYDLTDLTAGYDRSMPLKYFFIIETKSWGKGSGNIYNAAIMDYEYNESGIETPFNLPGGKVEIKSAGNKTVISVVVYGEPYYAPQNASLNGNKLMWEAPLPSTNKIEKYLIYKDNTKIAEVSSTTFSYDVSQAGTIDGSYSVTAVYEGGTESQKISVTAPIAFEEENMAVNFKQSGFKIPGIFDNKLENATIEFYIKPNSLKSWNQSAGPGWGTFMMHADESGYFYSGWDTNNRVISSSKVLGVGKWTHVAITVQGGKMTIYIDGNNRGSKTSTMYNGIGGFGDLIFSASGEGSAQDASYDEIRIWNRARSIAEVRNGRKFQYSGEVMPDGLIAYYKGDLITVDGKQMLREYINGNHAEILNNNYEATTSTIALTKPTSTLKASIDAVSSEVYAGIPVKLSATYSDAVAALKWTIEDAGLDNIQVIEPTVTFKTAGEQKVTLVAEDGNGNSVTSELTINVLPEKAIDATFHVSKDPVIMGEKISFIIDNPAFGVMYEWTITGSETEKVYGMHANAAFNDTGEQTVTLKATSFTSTNSATSTVIVNVLESEPVAAFEVNPAVIMKGEKTYLKDASKFYPTEWEWVIESTDKTYVINGRNSSLTPSVCGVYNVTLNVNNEMGSGTTTRERALIVCNADSKNGLGFGENAKVTAPFSTGRRDVLTVEWWMRPTQLTEKCLGIGQSEATFLINANTQGVMSLYANGYAGKSQPGFVIANEWHHYAAILNGGYVYFYRDGKYFSTSYVSTNAYIPELSTLAIGTDGAKMNGQIDELRVWSSVVKDDALLAVCNAPIESPAAYNDLMLYYDFNQAGGDVIDRTGNGHDGVRSGFGPDGDAWGLSRGVFCLNTEPMPETGEVTSKYLKNYQQAFATDNGKIVNPSASNRFYAIKDWTLENTPVLYNITTGAHVDNQKNNCMTFTTTWDGFSTLKDHKAYQTVTLPKGNYTFTANYHETWEGQCGNSYILAAEGKGLPNTANIDDAIAYTKMIDKDNAMSNSVRFSLDEETTVSLGLLVNIDGQRCMVIKKFTLETDNTEYIEADGETLTSIECIEEVKGENGKLKGIYDLSGRKLEKITQPGIYIINGKKTFIK